MQAGFIANLNEAHRSRIRITLVILDEALIKFEAWTQGREVRFIFFLDEAIEVYRRDTSPVHGF